MCKLTTLHGVTWEIITVNGRAAYQADHFMVFWNPSLQKHVLTNGLCKILLTGTLMECLDCVWLINGCVCTYISTAVA